MAPFHPADQLGRQVDLQGVELEVLVDPITAIAEPSPGDGVGGKQQRGVAYALAKTHREPLVFKGEDFSRTDIDTA